MISRTIFTNDLKFTLYEPEDGVNYNFCLVACNECGKSPSSICLDVARSTCNKPSKPSCITSEISSCGIRVDWFKGDDGGCNITEYRIYIESANGQLQRYTEDRCGKMNNIQACTISMERLQQAPFFLNTGNEIKVQASAVNEAGESLKSDFTAHTNNAIKMLDIPRALSKPTSFGKDSTGFTLAWNRLSADDEVQVFCGSDEETPHKLDINSWSSNQLSQSRRINFEAGARKYSCFVLACNDCGCSMASETEVVTLTDVPVAPQVVVFNPSACAVQVNWQLFGNGGSPIDQIAIEIAERNWEWTEWTGRCGNVGANSCQINMDDLGLYSQWGLTSGDRIQIRVRAHNENGWSDYSADHTGIVRMLTAPEKMGTPQSQIDGSMINIYW